MSNFIGCENCAEIDNSPCNTCVDYSNFKLWEGAQTVSKEKPSEPQGWENGLTVELQKAFTERFGRYSDYDTDLFSKRLKSFIRSLIQEREKKAVEEYDKKVIYETDFEFTTNELRVNEEARKEALKRVEPKSEGKGEQNENLH